ncbi:hypothetical protein P3T76_003591 [Phytophthora citrophthora]|uniref:Uncharacterized protein n=1 Tax=Phytophthora citrophthora TaxID=4793 RepID=A0AAD9GVM8_9STRA|nr:hypothetical protein P3T76_003591 [Phytophthora citrophthora]
MTARLSPARRFTVSDEAMHLKQASPYPENGYELRLTKELARSAGGGPPQLLEIREQIDLGNLGRLLRILHCRICNN